MISFRKSGAERLDEAPGRQSYDWPAAFSNRTKKTRPRSEATKFEKCAQRLHRPPSWGPGAFLFL